MGTPFVSPAQEVRKLQYWWLGFVGLLLAGGIGAIGRSYGRIGSISAVLRGQHSFFHQLEHQLFIFSLLLLVSYTGRKAVWWVAVGIIVLKAVFLVSYYLTTNYQIRSDSYYGEFSYCCTVLHLRVLPGLFFSDPINLVAMLGLYGYWLVVCRRILSDSA